MYRGGGLVHHPVPFHHAIGGEGHAPGDVERGGGDLGEGDEVRSAGGLKGNHKNAVIEWGHSSLS